MKLRNKVKFHEFDSFDEPFFQEARRHLLFVTTGCREKLFQEVTNLFVHKIMKNHKTQVKVLFK